VGLFSDESIKQRQKTKRARIGGRTTRSGQRNKRKADVAASTGVRAGGAIAGRVGKGKRGTVVGPGRAPGGAAGPGPGAQASSQPGLLESPWVWAAGLGGLYLLNKGK